VSNCPGGVHRICVGSYLEGGPLTVCEHQHTGRPWDSPCARLPSNRWFPLPPCLPARPSWDAAPQIEICTEREALTQTDGKGLHKRIAAGLTHRLKLTRNPQLPSGTSAAGGGTKVDCRQAVSRHSWRTLLHEVALYYHYHHYVRSPCRRQQAHSGAQQDGDTQRECTPGCRM
jgi:hypothetical protein